MALDGGEEEVQNAPWPDEKELGELPSWEEIGAAQVVVPKKLDERLTMLWARALMATLQRIAQRRRARPRGGPTKEGATGTTGSKRSGGRPRGI